MRRLRFILIVVATVLVAGVVAAVVAWSGGDDDDDGDGDRSAAAAEEPDLTATAEIRRSFARPGLVIIAVTNHGDEPVHIASAELLSDSFEVTGPQPFDSTIPPGTTPRDLQVEYGAAQCPDGVDSTSAASRVALLTRAEDGTEHQLELDLPHPNGTLDRLLRADCGAQLLADSVELALGPLEPLPDGTLSSLITVARVDGGAAPAVVADVRGSVLFSVAAQPDPALTAGQTRVLFDVLRCGGHAIGDAKRPYGFTAWIDLGEDEPIPTAIPVDDTQRAALDAMQAVRCAGRNGET